VLNFSELRNFSHVKTVAIMDELEDVVVLREEHCRLMLGTAYSPGMNVLLTAGQKGIIRGYSFRMKVIR
jgi:hypothetical protein